VSRTANVDRKDLWATPPPSPYAHLEEAASDARLWDAATELQKPRARVLIADDAVHVREVLRHFLTRDGYLVSAVEDGRELLDTVSTFEPDVVVVDMVMPGLTGGDVLTALRRAGVTVPVILISAYDAVVREGFFAVLTKPFNLRTLADTVATAVAREQSRLGA
jgi:CheY-like chemotaxis protein